MGWKGGPGAAMPASFSPAKTALPLYPARPPWLHSPHSRSCQVLVGQEFPGGATCRRMLYKEVASDEGHRTWAGRTDALPPSWGLSHQREQLGGPCTHPARHWEGSVPGGHVEPPASESEPGLEPSVRDAVGERAERAVGRGACRGKCPQNPASRAGFEGSRGAEPTCQTQQSHLGLLGPILL